METLNSYSMNGYRFTIWFFRMLLTIMIAAISLTFLLDINDSVSITEGELIASNPQCDHLAPFEAELLKVNVKEGQHVSKGDTLIVLQNNDYLIQEAMKKLQIEFLEKRIQSLIVLRENLQTKKMSVMKGRLFSAKSHQMELTRLISKINALNERSDFQKRRLSSASEKYFADSSLYHKDMLSKIEYNDTKDANLQLKENIAETKNLLQQQITERNLSDNDYYKEQNDFSLRQVELVENDQSLLQAKYDAENQLVQAKEALKQIETLLNERYIIATKSGVINYIFNTRNTSNLIAKGNLLISVAPQNKTYYAKVIVPEKDIQYIKTGLNALLKLDAYYYLEYGILEGKVSYLAERKEQDKFFALIDLPVLNNLEIKSGYSIQGEVVIQKMPLYKYIIKKTFKKLNYL